MVKTKIKEEKKVSKNAKNRKTTPKKVSSKNMDINTNLKSKNTNKRKSNYDKVKEKVKKDTKLEKNKQNKIKETKKIKQATRKMKQEEAKKQKKIINRLKNIFKRIFKYFQKILIGLKNLLINIFKYIKNLLKKVFCFITTSLKKIFNLKKRNKKFNNNDDNSFDYELNNINEDIVLKSLFFKELPLNFNKSDKKKRRKIYLKEAFVITIILTVVDIYGFYNVPSIKIFNIFDSNIWNLVLTISLTVVFIFLGSYFLDMILTELTIKKLKKTKKNKKS